MRMTQSAKSSRKLLQVSMKPELYEMLRQHCAQLDRPMAIWVRDLILREIQGRESIAFLSECQWSAMSPANHSERMQ
jgi:hypothetical protein